MENSEKKDASKLLGPDKLTAEQINALPKEKRKAYIRQMKAYELGSYYTAGMVKTLNAQHKEK